MTQQNSPCELLKIARGAKEFAYSPYSKFRVGAALVTKEGQVFTGGNVENANYSGTICAERSAICKAVSEGFREFTEIAITSDLEDEIVTPCGICRQALHEFSPDIAIYCSKTDLSYTKFTLRDLLPCAFGPLKMNSFKANKNSK